MPPTTCTRFPPMAALGKEGARVITRAKGVYLTDSEGEEILDAMAGLWCVNIGYGRDELADVAARQMRELPYYNTFFKTTHVPAIALAAKIAELAPGDLNHVFFAAGGSEANDTNIRLVRTYWAEKGQPDKNIIISRNNAYHGSSVGSASLGGMAGMHAQGGIPIPNIHHINQPNWWAEGGDMSPEEFGLARARELEEAILELGEDRVAAFIAEPVQGAGGVIVAPDTYWPEVQRICDKYDILLIADEVICGFGRTGNWFGSQTVGIKPHIMTIAKGLSSGYAPIGGSIVNDEIAEVIGGTEFNHGYTYSGHPVAAAVALENLRILEEEKNRRACPRRGRPLSETEMGGSGRSPAGGRGQDRRHDGLDRADPGQSQPRQVRLRARHGRLYLPRPLLCQQPDHAPCGRPDDHLAPADPDPCGYRRDVRSNPQITG